MQARIRAEGLSSLLRREWVLYVIAIALTAVATVRAQRLWLADWGIPFSYGADAALGAAGFKTVLETGWYEFQPLLNAPYGQVFHDWKIADNLGYLFALVLSPVIKNPYLMMNIYYILGFFLAAVGALWFFRLVGVGRTLSVVFSVLYAIAPYHFIRGENHLFLASYYPVPFAMGIVYLIARGQGVWGRASRHTFLGVSAGRPMWPRTILALGLVATANSYYAVFTILFIAFAGLAALIWSKNWLRFAGAVGAGVMTMVVMVVNMLPDMIYSATNGPNPEAVARVPAAIETYALKLAQLLLPVQGHRVVLLDQLRSFYLNNFPPQGEGPVLGSWGAIGLVILLVFALYSVVSIAGRPKSSLSSEFSRRIGVLSALTLFGFLLATTGGLSSLIGYFTSDLRAWNRISIVLALFCLGAVALGLDALRTQLTRRFRRLPQLRSAGAITLAGLVLLTGYLDQIGPGTAPNWALTQRAFTQDRAFVQAIEREAGPESDIVQLPYRDFPESAPVNGVLDTDQLKPYLHSSTLKWTGGGVKGRPYSEWVQALEMLPVRQLTEAAAAAGFDGVLVDRMAYGELANSKSEALESSLGRAVLKSFDGRYEFYSLTIAGRSLNASYSETDARDIGEAIVSPVLARLEPDTQTSFNGLDLTKPYTPRIMLENDRDSRVRVEVNLVMQTDITPRRLRFSNDDGLKFDADMKAGVDTIVRFEVVAPPGRSFVDISVVAGERFPNLVKQQSTITTKSLFTKDLDLYRMLKLR